MATEVPADDLEFRVRGGQPIHPLTVHLIPYDPYFAPSSLALSHSLQCLPSLPPSPLFIFPLSLLFYGEYRLEGIRCLCVSISIDLFLAHQLYVETLQSIHSLLSEFESAI